MANLTPEEIARRDQLRSQFGVRALNVGMMVTTEPPPRDYLFGEWAFVAGTYGVIFARGDSGKSYVALTMALTLALAGASGCNHDPLGVRPRPTDGGWPVLYVTAEDSDDEAWRRVHRLSYGVGPDGNAALARNLSVLGTFGATGEPYVTNPRFASLLEAEGQGSRLIVLDTFARMHCAKEDKSEEMVQVVAAVERLSYNTGAAVAVAHHTRKGGSTDTPDADHAAQEARGSSVITDHARWGLALARPAPNTLALVEAKHNYRSGPDPSAIYARWDHMGRLVRCDDPTIGGGQVTTLPSSRRRREVA